MINYRKVIQQAILLVAAITSCILLWQTSHHFPKNSQTHNEGIDAFMDDVHAIKINTSGHVEAEFFASKMWHYPQGNITMMKQPHFIFYDTARPPWHITALMGKAFAGITRIELWDQVIGKQEQGAHNLATTLQTEHIDIYPAKKIAETRHEVIAKQPDKTITSHGAYADLNHQTIDLLAQVRGEYVPAH